MAWQYPESFTIMAGQTVTIDFWWGVRTYEGVQVFQPRPSVGVLNTPFGVEKVAQGMSYFGRLNADGSVSDEWTYTVTVRETRGGNTIIWFNGGQVP